MKIVLMIALLLLFGCSPGKAASPRNECPTSDYIYKAEITAVYDGDTVTANIDLGLDTWRHREKIRLFGINAPEMRGAEKSRGVVSRDWLRSAILGRTVLIETIKDTKGKYGRYLGKLYVEQGGGRCLSVNDEIVRLGLAVYQDY